MELIPIQVRYRDFWHSLSIYIINFQSILVTIGITSETLNDWADEEAGLEAVQRVLDSLDDIHALQDPFVDDSLLHNMLADSRLSALLQVRCKLVVFWFLLLFLIFTRKLWNKIFPITYELYFCFSYSTMLLVRV